jgi:hypothetical protein
MSSFFKKLLKELAVVFQACNPSTQKAEVTGS